VHAFDDLKSRGFTVMAHCARATNWSVLKPFSAAFRCGLIEAIVRCYNRATRIAEHIMAATTTIRLPPELRARLVKHAESARKSQSAVIVQALEDYLERRQYGASQAEIDAEMQRLNELDRREPDYPDYLEGDEDPWGEGEPIEGE
jgi:predicted transcriptional regulator